MTLEHVLGHACRGSRTFELAAADGLVFDQVIEQKSEMRTLADLAGHVLQHRGCRLPVHRGNGFLRLRRHHELQPPGRFTQGHKARILCSPGFLDQGPAQIRIQPRRPAIAQCIEWQVTPSIIQRLEQREVVAKALLVR
ncbi:hypothetical protein D3C71_1240790 [compost metagenome]